jgi:hypothetical protein
MRKSRQLNRNTSSSRKNVRKSLALATPVEYKFSTLSSSLPVTTTGSILLLNGLHLGYAIDQRLGRSVQMDDLSLNIFDTVDVTAGNDQQHRFIVFVDHQANGVTPSVSDLLDSASPLAMPNLANRVRFTILHDETFILNAYDKPFCQKCMVARLPLTSKTTFNDSDSGTVSDIATNAVYLMVLGNQGSGSGAGGTLISSRVGFHNLI